MFQYLGKSVKIFLKDRADDNAAFWFKVTGAGVDYITGHDDEFNDLRIDMGVIDYIV